MTLAPPPQGRPDGAASAGADRSSEQAHWQDQVKAAQIASLFKASGATSYVPFFIMLALLLLQFDTVPLWIGAALLVAYVAVKLAGEQVRNGYRRAAPDAKQSLRWARRFACLSGLSGGIWGLFGFSYHAAGDPGQQAVLEVLVVGVLTASVLTRASYLPAFYAFQAGAAVPLLARLAQQGDERAWVLGGALLVYLAALSIWVRLLHGRERESLELAFMNASLRESLEQSREEAMSARDRAEDGYARTSVSLDNAQRLARLGNWDFDPQSGELFWSEQYRRMLEYPATMTPAFAAMLERVHPADRARVELAVNRARGAGTPFQLEYRLVTPETGIRYVVERCEAGTEEGRGSRRISSVVQDVTERHMAELTQQRGQQYLRTVLESVSDIIAIVAESGKVTFINQAVEAVLGRSPESLLGRDVFELVHEDDRERAREALTADSPPRHRSNPAVLRVRGGDGRYRDLEFVGRNLSANPLVDGTVVLARDVGLRQRTETKLREAKEQAELASLSKSNFLANMSHELRTPLNAILGFTELIESEVYGPIGNEQYSDYLSDIRRSGVHLLGLINDILDLSRIEAGAETLREQELDLRRALEGCVRLLAQRREQTGVDIVLDIGRDAPVLWVDRRKFNQIVINLLSNALKFTPAGGTATLRYQPCEDGGVRISVEDTGVGMRKEDIPLALKAFSQVDNSDTRRYEGAGLGLSICRALIELHGGALSIDSEPGLGTRVSFTLPRQRVHRPVAGAGLDEVVAAVRGL